MNQTQLIEKIKGLPDLYKQEVEDFVDFIIEKNAIGKNMTRQLGLLKGKMEMSKDFDAPIDDFKDYMR